MPDLDFQVRGVEAVSYAATPTLAFKLHITQTAHEDDPIVDIHSVILRCQTRIEPGKRRYDDVEKAGLDELFGEPSRWGQTVRSMLWSNLTAAVPAFGEQTQIDLPIQCTFDFNVAATKYFHALTAGDVPISFLFSGTIFYHGSASEGNQGLQVDQISWEKEATFKLPIAVWKQMMDLYYPNTAWVCIGQDLFDRLNNAKKAHSVPTLERLLESLLDRAENKKIGMLPTAPESAR